MKYVTIEECCDILDSQRIPVTSSERTAGIYPYYGANGLQDYVDNYIFDDDLILVAEDGGHFGEKGKAIAYKVSGKCWVNNHAHVLKPKTNYCLDYICYSLMFYDTNGIINGSTRKKLNQAQLKKMKVPFVPFEKQIEISNTIGSLFTAIDTKKSQLLALDELIKSRFIEMFGDPIVNDKGWKIKDLNEVTDVRDGTHDSPKYYDSGYPFITSKNLIDGKIDFSTCQLISKEDYLHFNERSCVDDGDILMPMIGTIGGAIIVKKDRDFAIKNVALIKFNRDNSIINRIFVLNILNSDSMNDHFNNVKKGGTQNFISLGLIRKIPTIVPPIELQNEFAQFVEQIDKSKFIVQNQIKDLQELLDKKMDEYFGMEE